MDSLTIKMFFEYLHDILPLINTWLLIILVLNSNHMRRKNG